MPLVLFLWTQAHNVYMGVVWAFLAITPFAILAWICSLFLGNVKLGEGTGPDEDGDQNIVVREVYLWTLVQGRNVIQGEEQRRQAEKSAVPLEGLAARESDQREVAKVSEV